ncbi:hypothetical protein Musp01_25320 [Muricauda sp. NBRC 101325]|nr:hypothetical protein Musp01_25320 [Muricauda sp. NBRC 101325]
MDNYDITADVGPETPTVKSFPVTVTDGQVNLYLSALAADGGVDQPKISAIRILESTSIAAKAPIDVTETNVDEKESGVLLFEQEVVPFDIILYPNPGATQVTISTRSLEANVMDIRIFDSTGQLVRSFNPTSYRDGNDYTLPVHSLQAGVYHLGIITQDGKVYFKQMIVRK